MPIYEYECCKCCEKFETLVFRSDEAVNCPKCDSTEVCRVMSVCGFKSGGDKGAASSRGGSVSAGSSCAGCSGGSCSTCR
ncbi:MAG: FmdB family zinc ribbon protein [Acidobacteriota bacterium]